MTKFNSLICIFFTVFLGLFLSVNSILADTFIATKTTDSADGSCDAKDCSLREAIMAANINVGDDEIQLPSGVYTLSISSGSVDENNLDLDITDTSGELSITTTTKTGLAIIDANNLDKAFEVYSNCTFSINNLRIVNGYAVEGPIAHVNNSGILNATNSQFINNNSYSIMYTSNAKGGFYLDYATLNLDNCLFTGNGGGTEAVYSYNGLINISNSQIINNNGSSDTIIAFYSDINISDTSFINNAGGSILIWANTSARLDNVLFDQNGNGLRISSADTVIINNSDFTNNTSSSKGGGIDVSGTDFVEISHCNITNNISPSEGGGVAIDDSNAVISDSLIAFNQTTGIYDDGGGIYSEEGALRLERTTVHNNYSTGYGGGISAYNTDGLIIINDSEISNNQAELDGGGISLSNINDSVIENTTISSNISAHDGGGIYLNSNSVPKINFCTITNNTAADGDTATVEYGGGIYAYTSAYGMDEFEVSNSIIENNKAGSGPEMAGKITSVGYNIFGNVLGSTYIGSGTDQIGISAGLLALSNNGGATYTHALPAGSIAVDFIPEDNCLTVEGSATNSDQRGQARPAGSGCDAGAYELQ